MRYHQQLSIPRRISTMSAALYLGLLFWCLQTNNVGAELAPPDNLTMITLNTNYVLSWDWDQSSAESQAVNFTTQYLAKYKLKSKRPPIWHTVCEKTSHRSCDLTGLNLYFLGIYVLRVQANVNGSLSNWTLKEFCPDKEAALGPPSKVELSPTGSNLEVFISDPLTSTNVSMKENHPELYYRIVYWEYSVDTQVSTTKTLDVHVNTVNLPNLKAWTSYCVKVQSRYDFYPKNSSFTSPLCMETEGNCLKNLPVTVNISESGGLQYTGIVPWYEIFGYFVLSLVICFVVVLLSLYISYRCYKTIKATFYPSVQLPTPFQYLFDSSGSDIPRLLTPDSDSEILCGTVTVCPEPPEIHILPPEALLAPPSDLEQDSSVRHSRQDSGGSGDSGVYSTGGSSLLQSSCQSSCQSSTGVQDSGQGHFDLKQMKMQDMAPGLKTQLLITDNCTVDMCV